MCIDLEQDEKRYYFSWENLEGSEDYILLENRGVDYRTDDYATGEFNKIVRHLQETVPEIRWRVTMDGCDREGADPSQWRVICVPEEQIGEAQEVFDLFLEGDPLNDYCPARKYPQIFDILPGRKYRLKAAIKELVDLLWRYERALFPREKQGPLVSLREISEIVPKIIAHGKALPDIPVDVELVYLGNMSRNNRLELGAYDEFYYYDTQENSNMGASLTSMLFDIYDEMEQALMAFSEDDLDQVAAAVSNLHFEFNYASGWPRELAIVQNAILNVIQRMESDQEWLR